jgi:TonB-linked SusC/RagA family outer membrane protein
MERKIFTRFLFLVIVLMSSYVLNAQRTVTGKIVDENAQPIPGVNIFLKGTTIGTISDREGNFFIDLPGDEPTVVVFSYVGYATQEILIENQTSLDIYLEPDFVGLDEVVVIGYGTTKKSDITGSLSSVTSEQILEAPVQNINQAIQGRAAGVDVYNRNFHPGEAPTIRIRGSNSIKAANDPLFVIDGIPTTYGINEINPMDIESVEILKDASASAIYGSRAANGVVLITTKRGAGSTVSINYNGSFGFEQLLRRIEMFDGGGWAELRREANRKVNRYNSDHPDPVLDKQLFGDAMDEYCWESVQMGYEWEDAAKTIVKTDANGIPIYDPSKVRTYDWLDHGLQTALNQNHQFSVSGGTENLGILLSVGYLNQEGVVISQNYERISTRLNMDYEVRDWFRVGVSNSYSLALQDYGTDMYAKCIKQLPIAVPYDTLGTLIRYPGGDDLIKNPLRDPELIDDNRRISRYFGSYYAEIEFLQGLRYRINVGQDYRYYRRGQFQSGQSSDRDGGSNMAEYDQDQRFSWVVENLLYYNKTINNHTIGVTLMQSASADRFERSRIRVINLPFESQKWYNVSTTTEGNPESYASDYRRIQIASFMGRVNYGLMDKYLFTGTIRWDGSSVFYKDNQWDVFPSFAFAWKAQNEAFVQNVDWISQLKVRLGYGTTGQSAVSPYETSGTIIQSNYCFDSSPARGFVNDLAETRDVGWEKTASMNAGIDFGFFRNRLAGTIDIYRANTYDLLLDRTVPAINGYDYIRANIGKVRNEGVEITLNTVNLTTAGGFRWETDLTFAKNKEQIMELYGDDQDDLGNRWFLGQPTIVYYDYEFDGIWQTEDTEEMALFNANGGNFEPGDIRVIDHNGDTTINEEDQIIIGTNVPDWTAGISNRFFYKGFEFSFMLYARIGQGIYNRSLVPTLAGRYLDREVDYWTATNPSNEYPRPDRFNEFPEYATALYYMNASFVRVRHITLSYNFPASLTSRIRVNSLSLYIQALNPFIFTDYPLLDPEVQGGRRTSDQNINFIDPRSDLNGLSTKSLVLGIRVGL